jgi:PTS system fructose-specific IIC component
MRISQLLPIDAIIVNLSATTKSAVIDELVNALDHAGVLNNKLEYKQSILAREAQITTGIGDGIAIPHAKTAAVKTSALAFGISPSGIDYESLDGEKAHIFFMIAAKANARNEHIETLSRLSRMLMSETFKNNLLQAQSASEVLQLIDLEEQKFLTPPKVIQVKFSEEKPLILAVTACPTGIAHTYMAADALNNKARSMEI